MKKEVILFVVFFSLSSLLLVTSCKRTSNEKNVMQPENPPDKANLSAKANPLAILQTGRQPLWFQLTENGPVHLISIEDAVLSSAFIPWPLALHIHSILENENEIYAAVNRDGFLKIALYEGEAEEERVDLAIYRFSGGEYWKQYTVSGFVFFNEKPAAVLYLDDRFLDTVIPPPDPRTWTFDMASNIPFPITIPALEFFPAEEGWLIDTFQISSDGFFYYRAVTKNASLSVMRCTRDLERQGDDISLGDFYNSFPHEREVSHPLLPQLPEGFIYTHIGMAAGNLFAAWEEQDNFLIGAAGFVVIK